MPELPEVETIKLGLSKMLPGHRVESVKSDWAGSEPGEYVHYSENAEPRIIKIFSPHFTKSKLRRNKSNAASVQRSLTTRQLSRIHSKSFPNSKNDTNMFLVGSKIIQVRRRAKVLIIDLDSKYSLVIHLKMTGQLVFVRQKQESSVVSHQSLATRDGRLETKDEVRFGAGHPTKSLVGQLPDKSTRVIFDLGSAKLYFNDQRKFGWVKLIPTIEIENINFFKRLGPEPLESSFSAKDFKERIRKRPNSSIKPVLLDQSIIAGVGNIYADESLWGAKIHPLTRVKDLNDSKLSELFKSLQGVLKLSIKKGGSTDKNYIDAEGKKGSYLKFANVFRRENMPCPRCGATIIKIRVAARGTHVCPVCQAQPR